MMRWNLLIVGVCFMLVLCCSACFGGSKQPSGESGSALELPENASAGAEVHTAGNGIKVIAPKERKERCVR